MASFGNPLNGAGDFAKFTTPDSSAADSVAADSVATGPDSARSPDETGAVPHDSDYCTGGGSTGSGDARNSAGRGSAAPAGSCGQADVEPTGPVPAGTVSQADSAGVTETGPIPIPGASPAPPGFPTGSGDPASVTAPHSVRAQRPSAPPPPGGGMPTPVPRFGSAAPQAPPYVQGGRFARRSPLRPIGRVDPARPPHRPEGAQRPLRRSRDATAVAFVLHQFPLGYMPVAASRPSRQVPPSETEPVRSGFPPHDHPGSASIEDTDALAGVRSGAAIARRRAERRSRPRACPAELAAGHAPLGERGELEWEHEYVLWPGIAGGRDRYAWPPAGPPGNGAPEEHGPESLVLEPDTVVDRFGSGEGRIVSVDATPFAQRSLPPEHLDREYHRYRVMHPLPVWRSVAAPWFSQPGGGVRYRATYPVADLVALGYLVELAAADVVGIDADASGPADTGTVRLDRDRVSAQLPTETPDATPEATR